MADLIDNWHKAMDATARAAAEAVVANRSKSLDNLTVEAGRVLSAATEAAQRADRAAALVETLHEVLAKAPREAFLASASIVLLTQVAMGDIRGAPDLDQASRAMHCVQSCRRASLPLIQRHEELPSGNYAVVISFHRLDGGEP